MSDSGILDYGQVKYLEVSSVLIMYLSIKAMYKYMAWRQAKIHDAVSTVKKTGNGVNYKITTLWCYFLQITLPDSKTSLMQRNINLEQP